MDDEIQLPVLMPDGVAVTHVPATCIGWQRAPDQRSRLRVEWSINGSQEMNFEAGDLFECLRQFRRLIEPLGYRVLVQGARRDVWASGMCRDMGEGRQAWVLIPPRPSKDLVKTFAPVDDVSLVGTVEEQDAFAQAAIPALRQRP